MSGTDTKRSSGRPSTSATPSRAACLTRLYTVTRETTSSSSSQLCRPPNASPPCAVSVPSTHPSSCAPPVYRPPVPPSHQLQGPSSSRPVHPLAALGVGGPVPADTPAPSPRCLGSFCPALCSPPVPRALAGREEQHLPSLRGRNLCPLMPECFQKFEQRVKKFAS